jgi:predicted nuclease of predicted toxin-antitoxin system
LKFLIDECLSPSLAATAREQGYPLSTHVTWLGLRAREDWALVRRAVDEEYVLVTNDRADFTPLMEREPRHPGLVCITVAHGLMSLNVQTELFKQALICLEEEDIAGRVLEIALRADRTVRFDLYPSTLA